MVGLVTIIRTILANWMAINRPVEGKSFHSSDGVWDVLLTLIWIYIIWVNLPDSIKQ